MTLVKKKGVFSICLVEIVEICWALMDFKLSKDFVNIMFLE